MRDEQGARSEADLVVSVMATCSGGHRVEVGPSAIGTPCWVCGCPLRELSEIDHRTRAHHLARP